MDELKMSVTLPVAPAELYEAWLDSKAHSAFTGAKAKVSSKVDGRFTAWDGYISGKNLKLKKGKQIIQFWRTSEFPDDAPDSLLQLTFEKKPGGKTLLTLNHTNIPAGQGKNYKSGWKDFYFDPIKKYFSKK